MIRILLISIFIVGGVSLQHTQENQNKVENIKEKLDTQTEKAKAKWKYNPFRKNDIERRLIGWQDPYANITRLWLGGQLNDKQMYPNPNFNTENIFTYLSPVIATELSVIAFEVNNFKFRLGIGVLAEFNFAIYDKQPYPKYGKNFLFTDYI